MPQTFIRGYEQRTTHLRHCYVVCAISYIAVNVSHRKVTNIPQIVQANLKLYYRFLLSLHHRAESRVPKGVRLFWLLYPARMTDYSHIKETIL